MCLWLLTACLGLLPGNSPPSIVVVPGVPAPILLPTTAATTVATTASTTTTSRPANMTTPPPSTPTPTPTTAPTPTPASTPTPTPTPTPGNMTTTTPRPPATNVTTASTTMTPAPTTVMPPTTTTPRPATTAPPATSAGGAILQLIFCNDPDTVCVFNPDDNTTGPLPIDPRVGTTPGPSAAFRSDVDSQVPSYDTAVKFPRQRRDVKAISIKDFLKEFSNMDGKHKITKRQSCRCVTAGTCINNGNTSPAGMIDVRIVTPVGAQCPSGQEYCCGNTTTPITNTTQVACGTLQTVPTTAVTPTTGQANFGEFPWQALILTRQNDYVAGGILIDGLNVITVTHRLASYVVSGTAPNIKVRLGEWDAAGTYEPIPYQEYTVQKVFTHSSYNVNTLQFDITVLRLTTAVPFTPATGAAKTINRACLPPASNATYNGQRCLVSGWGKDMFGISGQYQQILKKVEVPIVAPDICQGQLRTARLGATYVLDTTSFVCAGGEVNKDSCTGDGGSGMVCQVNGQWVVVGLVAWGLGCASANVSGVYVNIAGLLPWIQTQVATQ